jgi:LPPG:FO 2-phospho-L-lactate transferase
MEVALLAGGTGGAKLAVGLRDLLHGHDAEPAARPGRLSVIANTADDIEIHGVHVSPDPDLISFRLAGVLDERGFGIAGERHEQMDARRAAGEDVWFELGDDDLAVCATRAALLAEGRRQTEAHARAIADHGFELGGASVLPMCDEPLRTIIDTPDGPRGVQQFLIQDRAEPEILGVRFDGAERATVTPEVRSALERAELVVIGPSNPAISIAPILAAGGVVAALRAGGAPVLAVSPLVGGRVLKGPTARFMAAAGFAADSTGVAAYYESLHPGLIDAWIADEPVSGHPHCLAHVAMGDPQATRAVAADVLEYGASLAPAAVA